MNEGEIIELLKMTGVIMEGHFLLTSGRHSDTFLQFSQVLRYPRYTSQLAQALAERFAGVTVDLVIGPAMGGVILGYEVARVLGVAAIYCEKDNGKMALRRGFTIEPGQHVLVVEDAVSTGGSVKQVIDVVKENQGVVVGVGVLADRSGGKVHFDVPTHALLALNIDSFLPEACPLCRAGIPLAKPKGR